MPEVAPNLVIADPKIVVTPTQLCFLLLIALSLSPFGVTVTTILRFVNRLLRGAHRAQMSRALEEVAPSELGKDEHRHKRRKLSGSDLFRDVLGSPKFVVAPMVDQSELV